MGQARPGTDRGAAPRTLIEKIWDDHVIADLGNGVDLLHVDRHLLHEVTSRRGFERLHQRKRRLRSPALTYGVVDHVVGTQLKRNDGSNPAGQPFIETMRRNCTEHGVTLFDLHDSRQGIVHVIGPELGITLPGCTLVCGDSHTSSNGAVGALAWGIGASEVEHVMATQTLVQRRPKLMRLRFDGRLGDGVSAKDAILHAIGRLGTAAGRGYLVEFAGAAISSMEIDGRLTLCNMSIEMGAKAGIAAPDDRTIEYLAGREFAPKGALWDKAVDFWRTLKTDDDAKFDREEAIDCNQIGPQITWGTSPQDVVGVDEPIPDPSKETDPARRKAVERALAYTGLAPGQKMAGQKIDYAFIGSCTNSRLSDLVAAANVVRGRKVAPGVRALVVPGSTQVKRAAEAAGLDRIFIEAGFEWHSAGCSMCVVANGDVVPPGKRCISTSNRNFEGRQGPGAITHLASPASVAAAAVSGVIVDVRRLAS
jgi:3-isopropylmalate/(R)-2-methylmalate dehydratase large subunit